ncbi:MAG TPA: hypothetical protein VGL81_13665 [Polyangiaceae bacterium]|jgi:hypothetical protein
MPAVSVAVTVTIGSRTMPLDQVTDARISTALRAAGLDIGRRLEALRCPVHHKTASNIRVHFDAKGNADLKYDSCCAELGAHIGKALG